MHAIFQREERRLPKTLQEILENQQNKVPIYGFEGFRPNFG